MNTKGLKTPLRIEYWSKALSLIQEAHKDTGYFQDYRFSDDVWLHGERVGGFKFVCSANRDKSRVELNLSAPHNPEMNRSAFDYLFQRRKEIEEAFGDRINWGRDYSPNSSFITHWNLKLLINDRDRWDELALYHAYASRRFYEVFTPYLREWNKTNGYGIENFIPVNKVSHIKFKEPDLLTEEMTVILSNDDLYRLAVKHSTVNPEKEEQVRQEYRRDSVVTAYAKRRANGICQLCRKPAPFNTPNGDPYLEVHHIDWLMNGGADSVENTVALCPNCHRKMHSLNLPEDVRLLKESAHL